uniref:Uncharacterized protein n=1 Tax=Romanomermis culicivorax TaxID=13658 RepID=A0A915K365_ROMCU
MAGNCDFTIKATTNGNLPKMQANSSVMTGMGSRNMLQQWWMTLWRMDVSIRDDVQMIRRNRVDRKRHRSLWENFQEDEDDKDDNDDAQK